MTPKHLAALAAVTLSAAVIGATALTAGGSTTFESSQRVRVIATGELGTVDHVLGDRVVVYGDGTAAPLRTCPPSDLEPATPPATTTTTSTTTAPTTSWNGFGIGNWPTATWRPYLASSPFNQPVGSTTVHPDSAAIITRSLSFGNGVGNLVDAAGASNDYAHPTYYAKPTDPIFTLDGVSSSTGIEGLRIPIPDKARPAGGSDAHMTVVTPDGWEYDFWQVKDKPAGGGTMTFSNGGRIRIDGDGLRGRATAANFGNLAGVIRAQELIAGRIDHALFIVIKCTTRDTTFGYGTTAASYNGSSYVWPATHAASPCATSMTGLVPAGARFQLAMSDAQIQALTVPVWKKTILTALARYGGYVGDTGGPGFGFMFESSTMYTSLGQPDPLAEFAKTNNVPTWNGQ